MSLNTLTYPVDEQSGAISVHDRVQIALAIAEPNILKSLLVNCTPPLAQPHLIGSIASQIGVPVESRRTVDGVISFEALRCIPVDSPTEIEEKLAATTEPKLLHREYLKLTRCESETHTLGHALSLAQSIATLNQSGFTAAQIEEILNLPTEAWHKSWWYSLDEHGHFTVPFLRLMRPVRYPNGTITLQYKDYFAQDQPPCFASQEQKVLIEIKTELQSFRKTLERINLSREQLGITQALLICDSLSELEARGFISQGISLYTARELILHTHSDCSLCTTTNCPLNRKPDSPVLMCRHFCLDGAAHSD